MRRRRWPSAALPVRAEPSPRGGGSPGTHRQREGGRLTRRRKTAPANMALWRAPAGARSRRPPTPRGRPPSRARPRAAAAGEGEATAVTGPGRPRKPAWARPRAKASRAKEGQSCIFRLEKWREAHPFFKLGLGRGGGCATSAARPAPPPFRARPRPRGLRAPQGPEPPSQRGPRGPAGRGVHGTWPGPAAGLAARLLRRPGLRPAAHPGRLQTWLPALHNPRARPRRRPHAQALPPGEDRAGKRLKVCFSTRRPPRGHGGPRAPKS